MISHFKTSPNVTAIRSISGGRSCRVSTHCRRRKLYLFLLWLPVLLANFGLALSCHCFGFELALGYKMISGAWEYGDADS